MKKKFLIIFAVVFYITSVFSQSDTDSSSSSSASDSDNTSSSYSSPSDNSGSSYSSSTDNSSSSGTSSYDNSYSSSSSSSFSTSDSYSSSTPSSSFSSQSEEKAKSPNIVDKMNLKVLGNANILMGQIVSGYESGRLGNKYMTNRWQNSFEGRLEVKSQPKEWYYTDIALGISTGFPVTMGSAIQKELFKIKFKCNVPKAVGVFDFDFDKWDFFVETGMFEYAFNPDVTNLGNYMYRSTSYPFCVKTKIDYIYSNLLGIQNQYALIDHKLKLGWIFNSLYDQYPFNDFSLAFFAGYTNSNKFLDFGAGICFDRLFSVESRLTDCENIQEIKPLSDSTITFRSTKIDARLTLDPKQLFGNPSKFGKNDLKIYGELAILGTKTPKYYPKDTLITASLINRMPMMIGFNIPTFKVLDVFSAEFEFCANPYSNDWWGGRDGYPSPEPNNNFSTDSVMTYWHDVYKNKDNWKWSIYLKKSISNFDAILMFANDHSFYETANAESQSYWEQTLRTKKDWQWYLKLQYNL